MKLKRLCLGLAVTLVTLIIGGQQVHADINVSAVNTIFYSNNQPLAIYSDPELTKATGQKLSTDIADWSAFEVAKEGSKNISYKLGHDQWVPATSGYLLGQSTAEMYSGYKAIQLYSDPALSKPAGKLSTNYNLWATTKWATPVTENTPKVVDLGNNQWADINNFEYIVYPYETIAYYNAGTPLYNLNGVQTSTIHVSDYYKTYRTYYYNGKDYVNLGNDSQWVRTK